MAVKIDKEMKNPQCWGPNNAMEQIKWQLLAIIHPCDGDQPKPTKTNHRATSITIETLRAVCHNNN